MLVGELKGLDQTQGLIYWTPHWKVVDGDLPQDALVINNEQASANTGTYYNSVRLQKHMECSLAYAILHFDPHL